MGAMFFKATDFNNGGVSLTWDTGTGTSNVTNMFNMFRGATSFNQNISSWDVSNVTNMGAMFFKATSFNQDISGWCVSNIATTPVLFDSDATAWTDVNHKPVWGTCP
jgi:surface protein